MSGNTKNNPKNLEMFYTYYHIFLEIDSIASLIYGRNRELIKAFYHLYLKIANGNDLKDAKEHLKKSCEDYIKLRGSLIELKQQNTIQKSQYSHILYNPNITQAFKTMTEAITTYQKWRKCLAKEDIQKLYIANLQDRHKYYANKPLKITAEILQSTDIQNMQNNQILKQTLIEFHNAISHLHKCLQNSNESNKERAINHFKRGALDSYKAIIKDYFCLLEDDEKEKNEHFKDFAILRQKEYQKIGDDDKISIFNDYKQLAEKIITTTKNKHEQSL